MYIYCKCLEHMSEIDSSCHFIIKQIYITHDIISIFIGKLKAGKDDGNIGFKAIHIINGTHRLLFYYNYCKIVCFIMGTLHT